MLINTLLILPLGTKGEKQKDTRPGAKVFLSKLDKPKTKPKNIPDLRPKRRVATITVMWIIVALITPSGINPKNGTTVCIIIIATNTASKAMCFVFL